MSDDIASVGIKVGTDDITKGINALDALADQGPKVEKSLQGVEAASAKTGKSLATLGQGSSDAGLAKVAKSGKDAADSVGKLADTAAKTAAAVKAVDKSSGETARAIFGVSTAVKALVTSNEAVAASIRGVASAENAYISKLQEEARQLRANIAERDKYVAQAQGMLSASKDIAAAIGGQVGALRQVQAATAQTSESMLAMVRTGVGAFLGGAVVAGAKAAAAAIYEASAAGERLRTMLNFATGGKSAEEIEYLRKVTSRLGLEFDSTARAYGQFQAAAKGTALEGQKARDVFESIAKASAVMGLSTEQSSGALLALQQMISKGTVQAEELRGQLGERLPGAFQIAAKAMGVTTAELGKMLEQGQVVADDFLPKFAKAINENIGGAADAAADRLDAATNRFGNAWERLKQTVGDAGVSKLIQNELKAITDDMTVFQETVEKVRGSGGGLASQLGLASLAEVGRLGFSDLSGAANAFNATVNTLTGNVLNLSTSVSVLPDFLRTNAQQAALMEKELAKAEKRFAELKEQGGTAGGNVYWKSELFQISEYIRELKAAKAERDKLSAPSAFSQAKDSAAADVSEAARLESVRAAMQKVQQGLSGVKDSFFKDLNALKAGYDAGLLKLDAYQAAVKKLIDEDGGGKAAASALKASGKELEDQKKLIAELAGLTVDFYQDWDSLNRQFKAGKLNLEQLVAARSKLLEKQPGIAANAKAEIDAAKQIAESRAAARRAEEKAIAEFTEKQREQASAALKGIRDRTTQLGIENAASVVAQKGNVSLAEAINKVTIARLKDKAAGLQDGSEAKQAILDQIEAYKALGEQLSAKELNDFLDPARAQTFGQALTGAFEQAGSSLAKLSGSLKEYADNQRQISANMARLGSEADPAERARKSLLLQNKAQENSIALYANMAGAAKGFFREGTKGYKALEAAETAFRLVQLASDLQKGLSAAAVGIATQAQGDPYSAFPRMAAMAAAMAALGFAVVGFGGGGSSGGGDGAPVATGTGTVLGDSSAKSESLTRALSQLADTAKLQLTTQSGMLSALRNIENNIGGLASLVVRGNTLSDSGVQTGTTLSLADPFTRSLFGKIGDSFTTKIFEALFGKKITVTGQGLSIGSATLGQINAGGVDLSNYTDVNSKQKFFGITVSNKNSTNYSPADPLLEQQFTKVFQSLYAGILSASGPLGVAFDQVKAQLDGFVLNIGKIDLSGLSGTQITEKLTAIIGAAADSISTAAIPGLQDFQKVGEGYFETLVRVASGVETAKDDLSRLGIVAINYTDVIRKQGDVAAEIVRQSIAAFESADGTLSSVGALINNLDASADDLAGTYKALVGVRDTLLAVGESGDSLTASMLQGAGGLDELANSLSTYLGGKFFSDQERASAALASLQSQFARIGIQTVPQTYEQFRTLVASIDTTTDAGQRLYGQVIGLAGAFQTAQDAAEKASTTVASRLPDILKSQASERNGLMVDLLKAQGDAAGAAALKRSQDLATLTAGLSAAEAEAATAGYDYIASLRAQIDATNAAAQAATQAAAAEAQRAAAVASERTSLETQLLQAQGDTAALRARELQSLDPSNRALQERLYLLADEQAAADAAAQAAKDLADKLTAIATERDGIQSRIDELLGNTAAIRSRELATLDESNRALQERLYALQDEQAAAQAAAQAAQQLADQQAAAAKELADQQAAIARERFGLEGQLMQLLGDTAGLRARELAALDPSNRALQEKIYALLDEKDAQQRAAEAAQAAAQAAQDAARAAEQMRAAWQSVTDSLFEEVKRIRDLMSGNGKQSLASAQAQFAITTAQARAGDQEAAKLLPGLSQTLLQLAEANAGSLLDLQRIRAQIAASLEQTGAGFIARFGLTLPKFAVGTNYVPRDMAAIVHEGEAIVPRAYNPAASGGGANGAASGALLQEVAGLREDNQAQALAIVKLQTEISRLLKKWDSDGIPEERKVAA